MAQAQVDPTVAREGSDVATQGDSRSKVYSAAEAIRTFVGEGMTVGMGGQNINRCPMALVHEVIRQGIGELSIVGCNLSLPVDLLVASGLVRHTEQGSGNLERYGVLYSWRRALESGTLTTHDHSHLAMASRFLAGAMGIPFLPTRSLVGSTIATDLVRSGLAIQADDPFGDGQVLLLRAQAPDVALIHVSRVDEIGNVAIDGVSSHEVDMVRASRTAVVSAEQVLPAGAFYDEPERVTISGAHVTAVVEQRYGAFPTSVYRHYDFSEPDIKEYQAVAKSGGDSLTDWLQSNVLSQADFDSYLADRSPDIRGLERQMRSLQ